MEILDIFSKKPIKKKKEVAKILVDNREKSSLVPSKLKKLEIPLEFKQLKVADYIIKDIAVERKTIHDFQNSIINKRLISQLKELKQYPKHLLIVEGEYNPNERKFHENAFRGFILSTLLTFQVPIVFTKDPEETAKYLETIAKKKKPSSKPIRASKITLSTEKQIQFILEGFPNIGPKSIEKLKSSFSSLKELFNASEEELKKILGKKGSQVYEIINYQL